MKNRTFGLIGNPLTHSMSPFIHKRLFLLSELEGSYNNIEIPPENLKHRIDELKTLRGFNVTIPHKLAIIPFLDELEEKAALFGSVNTVSCEEITKGYNTDFEGFLRAISNSGIVLEGSVLIVGSGGTSRMFAFEAALRGCEITICAREADLAEANKLKDDINAKISGSNIKVLTEKELTGHFNVLLHGTPLGMYPKNMGLLPLDKAIISKCAAVFDAVYNPEDTALLQLATANGSKTARGMRMLVWQAVAAHEIWDHVSYRLEDIETLIAETNSELKRVFNQ